MPIVATLTITMDEVGNINVNGPIDNRLLCYGLLEVAKDTVTTHCAAANNRIIQPAGTLRFPVNGG